MCPRSRSLGIRTARPQEFGRLREIEHASDQLFAQVGIGPFSEADEEDYLNTAAMVLLSGDPPVGFASVKIVDGVAHLWQLSVHPSGSRQGRGSTWVTAVCDWALSQGFEAVTLTTFRDVPWNGPFYERMGFRSLDELTAGLSAIRDNEKAFGDDDFGPRIAMRKDLGRSAGPAVLGPRH